MNQNSKLLTLCWTGLNWFMDHALFWSHALYKPKWQVAKSLLSYYIPTYIVMMAQLMYNQKAIHYCLWATKKKEEQIVELHISWCLTPFPLLPKIYFFGQKAVSSLPPVFPFLDFGDWKAVGRQEKRFFLLLAFYRSCAISDTSFADSSAGNCQIRTWMLWKLSGTRLFRVGWQLET